MQNFFQILLIVHKVFQNGQHCKTQNCPPFLSLGLAHNHRKENSCLQFLLCAQELGTFAAPDDSFPILTFISSKTQTDTLNSVFPVLKAAVLISHMQDHGCSPLPTLLFVWPFRNSISLFCLKINQAKFSASL